MLLIVIDEYLLKYGIINTSSQFGNFRSLIRIKSKRWILSITFWDCHRAYGHSLQEKVHKRHYTFHATNQYRSMLWNKKNSLSYYTIKQVKNGLNYSQLRKAPPLCRVSGHSLPQNFGPFLPLAVKLPYEH